MTEVDLLAALAASLKVAREDLPKVDRSRPDPSLDVDPPLDDE